MKMQSQTNLILSTTNLHEPNGTKTFLTKSETSKWRTKLKTIISCITVEPLMCFYSFPLTLALIGIYNLTFQMACQVNLQLDTSICDNLLSLNNTEYEILVEKEAAKLLAWKRPVSTIIPAVLIIFMGSYSDRYKIRKPFLIIPFFGEILSSALLILCTINISNWPMETAAISEIIFQTITGGFTTVKLAAYSYVADITTLESRTTRFGIAQVTSSIMSPLARFLSGITFTAIGFYGIFLIRLVVFGCGACYGLFCIKEPKKVVITRTSSFLVDFFNPKNLRDTFNIFFRKQTEYRRIKLILILVAFIVVKGSTTTETDMLFLYTRLRYQWDEVKFTFYTTFDLIVRVIGSALAIPLFSQWLKLDDYLVLPITFLTRILSCVLMAYSSSPSMLYVASVVGLMNEYQTIPLRSLATKLANDDELGKIQSLFGICEAFAPSIYGPLYSEVYRATVDTIPGAYYLVSASILAPLIPAFVILYIFQKKNAKNEDENKYKKQDTFRYILSLNELL